MENGRSGQTGMDAAYLVVAGYRPDPDHARGHTMAEIRVLGKIRRPRIVTLKPVPVR